MTTWIKKAVLLVVGSLGLFAASQAKADERREAGFAQPVRYEYDNRFREGRREELWERRARFERMRRHERFERRYDRW